MDRLETMFEKQKELQKRLGTFEKIESKQDKQQYVNQMAIAMYEEVSEILRATPYKNPAYVKFGWKKNQPMNKELFLEECVDLFHFLMNMLIANGLSDDDFYRCYVKKNNINHDRQDNNY